MSISTFSDVAAERAVLAGVFRHGLDAYVDAADLIDSSIFSLETNQVIWSCLQDFYEGGVDRKLDYSSLESTARKLHLSHLLEPADAKRHVRALMALPVEMATVRQEAAKIFKLSIAKEYDEIVAQARRDLHSLTGDESLSEILATVENPLFEFTASLNSDRDGPIQIAEGGMEWLDNILKNPCDNIGIPSPFPRYNERIGGGFRRGTVSMVGARPKQGKASTLSSLVYTPGGPVRMGDISVGDKVSTPSGGVARVVSVHPQGVKDIYRVVFADGDSAECCLEHLWEVKHNRKSTYEVMSLEKIVGRGLMDGGNRKWKVRLPEYCHYDNRDTPLDPYLLGLLIGDGGLVYSTPNFTNSDVEIVDSVRGLLPKGHDLVEMGTGSPGGYRLRGNGKTNEVTQALRELGLHGHRSDSKFIPECYKYNSLGVRIGVLQGLFDTDGSVDESGNVEYSTTSKRLAYDVKEVFQSVGGLCRVTKRKTRCQTGEFWSYRLHIKHDNKGMFFRLQRKKGRTVPRKKPPLHRTIKRVEYVGKEPAQCIMLDSPEGLYMTDHHIVTHNTVWCDNVCQHVSGELSTPTFNLDTEMTQEEHLARILVHRTGITIDKIERGQVSREESRKLREAMGWLQSIPYYYESVVDKTFEEQIASIRRWVVKHVGHEKDGRTKDCLVVYDYLQLTDPGDFKGDFKEYQLLGFQMLALLRVAHRMDIPILSMMQLNRDGIDKETTAVASGSDRIIWKCASFSILKRKDIDEIKDDGPEAGTSKLITLIARHGPECSKNDYINLKFDGATAKMTEGLTRNELHREKKRPSKGFEVEVAPDERFELSTEPVLQQ